MPAEQRSRSIQIEEQLFLAGTPEAEAADHVAHSCDPNCGLRGSTVVVALRDIAAGEALTYDHGTHLGSEADAFGCHCGSAGCRGAVTGSDWMLPELQLRYRGHFSPYLAARIAALTHSGAERRAFSY
jgi:hypothetical protein